jgi:hypothetical protein
MIAEQTTYSTRHGSPYDRGSADSYYGRSFDPHYWPQGTYNGTRVEMAQMTAYEITAYTAGYRDNEESGDFKEY